MAMAVNEGHGDFCYEIALTMQLIHFMGQAT